MNLNRYSRYRLCSYVLWLIALNVLTVSSKNLNYNNLDVCTTPACINAENLIKTYIDESEDPCHNFYDFVCGNMFNQPSLEDYYQQMSYNIEDTLINALNQPIGSDEPKIFQDIKKFYRTCTETDLDLMLKQTKNMMTKIIKKIGGLPMKVGNSWAEDNFDWISTADIFQQFGFKNGFLLSLKVVNQYFPKDAINGTNNDFKSALQIEPAFFPFNDDASDYDSNKLEELFSIARFLDVDVNEAEQEIRDLYDFIDKLSRYDDSDDNISVKIGNLPEYMTLNNSLLEYINFMTNKATEFSDSDEIIITDPNYFIHVSSLLQSVDKRTLANFASFKVYANLFSIYRYFSDNGRNSCFQVLLNGPDLVRHGMEALLIREKNIHLTVFQENVHDIIVSVMAQIEFYVNQLKWLDDEIRSIALNKIQSMKHLISFSIETYDTILDDKYCSNLHITTTSTVRDYLNIQRADFKQKLFTIKHPKKSLLPIIRYDYKFHHLQTDINAFYTPYYNTFVLLAGYLIDPGFNLDWTNYMKYSSLGTVIGHEIMHGFGHEAADREIKMSKIAKIYDDKQKCFVDYYGNFFNENLNLTVNGMQTLEENLADYGGTLFAYTAYKKWVEENGREPQLPGLKYNNEQIFWIMLSLRHCSKDSLELERTTMLTDAHTLNKYRILGILQNSKHFAKDFNCPVGSKMNPVKKCSLAKK